MVTLDKEREELSARVTAIENQPFTEEEKDIHARIDRFQLDREFAMQSATKARIALERSLEQKAMLNEEIRARLIRQADWIADMEDIEVFLEGEKERILEEGAPGQDDILLLEVMTALDEAAKCRKILLESLRMDAMERASGNSRLHIEGDSPLSQFSATESLPSPIGESGGLSPDARDILQELKCIPDSSGISGSLNSTIQALNAADARVASLLPSIMSNTIEQIIDCHSRMKQLDLLVHRNIVTIETTLAEDRLACERSTMNDRLDNDACSRRLLDMHDEEDALINELTGVMERRDSTVIALIEEAYSDEFKAFREKDSEVKEYSLMLSTATSRLSSLKALQGFIRHRERLQDIRELEGERERLTEEKSDLHDIIIKRGLPPNLSNNVSRNQLNSGNSSRRPSIKSTSKLANHSLSSNLLTKAKEKKKTHIKNHSSGGGAQMVMTFGKPVAEQSNYRQVKVNDDTMRSCPLTFKQSDQYQSKKSQHVFETEQENLVKIKWEEHVQSEVTEPYEDGARFEGNQLERSELPVPRLEVRRQFQQNHQNESPFSLQNTKRSAIVTYGSSTSRLFEMRENLRRHVANSKDIPAAAKEAFEKNRGPMVNNPVYFQQSYNVQSGKKVIEGGKKTHSKNISFPGSKSTHMMMGKQQASHGKGNMDTKPVYLSPARLVKVGTLLLRNPILSRKLQGLAYLENQAMVSRAQKTNFLADPVEGI